MNYGGSTGFGRPYRELLHEQWGVVDLEDCIAAARHLAEAGEVDAARLSISGGSAGGYTTLLPSRAATSSRPGHRRTALRTS